MLDVRRLWVLRSVVNSGSVNAAAANLGYTPSAISQQIAALQRETGTTLFEKSGRGLKPTAAAVLLAEHADGILTKLDEAESALADLRSGRTGRLTMRYFTTAGLTIMPPVIARLRNDFPDLHLDLRLCEIPDDAIADIEVNLLGPDFVAHPNAVVTHLMDDPYYVIVRTDHPLADRGVIDLAELSNEPWIENEWPTSGLLNLCQQMIQNACAAAGFTPNYAVESSDYPTAMAFVVAGLGVTVVPGLALSALPSGTVALGLRHPEPIRSIYVVVHDPSANRDVVASVIDTLQTTIAGMPTRSIPVG